VDDKTLNTIKLFRLFNGVDLSALAEEWADTRLHRLAAGKVLLDPSLINHEIHLVLSGELLVCMDPQGPGAVAHLRAGDCAGELSLLDENPPSAYVIAGTECELLSISQECLWRMMKKQHSIAFNLLRILAERFRHNTKILLDSLEMQRAFQNSSESDPLTGLRNQTWAREVFPKQLELSDRVGQAVCLAILNIDHFHKLLKVYGTEISDHVLQIIGHIFKFNLRSTDLSSRYSNEEFVVMMPGTPLATARMILERLRQKVEALEIQIPNDGQICCTLSIGVAEWRSGIILDELIRSADINLYHAKALGGNQVCDSPGTFSDT
jgi:diguanylate cyclase (GGDEF)-like protein